MKSITKDLLMFYPNTKFATALVAFSSNSSFVFSLPQQVQYLTLLVGWSVGRLVRIQIVKMPMRVDSVDAQRNRSSIEADLEFPLPLNEFPLPPNQFPLSPN